MVFNHRCNHLICHVYRKITSRNGWCTSLNDGAWGFFGWIGDRTPLLRSYLGGGAIVAIFGSAFLMHMNWMPEETTLMITDFMQDGGFLNFYIAGLITGSIL